MRKQEVAHMRELACALRDSHDDDGVVMGLTDAEICLKALVSAVARHDRRRKIPAVIALSALVLAGAATSPSTARLADVNGDGIVNHIDMHALATLVSTGSADQYYRTVEFRGGRYHIGFSFTETPGVDQVVKRITPLDAVASATMASIDEVAFFNE